MSKKTPFIDSLHTLSVWSNLGSLMVQWYEHLNGQRRPYVHSDISLHGDPLFIIEGITKSLSSRGLCSIEFRVDDRRQNCLRLSASVICALPLEDSNTAWLLMLKGELVRHAHDKEGALEHQMAPVAMPCYYDPLNGRGFCLLPELARQQVGCND